MSNLDPQSSPPQEELTQAPLIKSKAVAWLVILGVPLLLIYLVWRAITPSLADPEVKYVQDERTGEPVESQDANAKSPYPADKVESLKRDWLDLLMKEQNQSVLTQFQSLSEEYTLLPEYGLTIYAHDANSLILLSETERLLQSDLIESLQVPQLKLYYSLLANPLVYIHLVSDSNSLVATDVQYLNIASQTELTSAHEAVPTYVANQFGQAKAIYEYDVKLDDEFFTAYAVIFNDDYVGISGLYGETNRGWFDVNYWLANESIFESVPLINQS